MQETTKLFNDFLKIAKKPEENPIKLIEMLKYLGEYNLLDDLLEHTIKKLKGKKQYTERESLNYYNAVLEWSICIKIDNPKQEMKITKINDLRLTIENKFKDNILISNEITLNRLKDIQKIYLGLKNFSMHLIPTNLDEIEKLIDKNMVLTKTYLNSFIKEKTAEIKGN